LIKALTNISRFKTSNTEIQELVNLIEKELTYIRQNIPTAVPPAAVTPTVVSGSSPSPSAPATTDDRAGIVAITTVADQFIPFTSAITGSYVLSVWFLDSAGSSAMIGVLQADWLGNGFWLRSGLIPLSPPTTTSGMLFYIAKKVA
jgi:hypothetical protein